MHTSAIHDTPHPLRLSLVPNKLILPQILAPGHIIMPTQSFHRDEDIHVNRLPRSVSLLPNVEPSVFFNCLRAPAPSLLSFCPTHHTHWLSLQFKSCWYCLLFSGRCCCGSLVNSLSAFAVRPGMPLLPQVGTTAGAPVSFRCAFYKALPINPNRPPPPRPFARTTSACRPYAACDHIVSSCRRRCCLYVPCNWLWGWWRPHQVS